MVERTREEEIASFIDDVEKMRDFILLNKTEFLKSYSYINEGSYDLTKHEYNNLRDVDKDILAEKTGVRKIYIVSEQEDNDDKIIKRAFKNLREARMYLFKIVGKYVSNESMVYDVHKNEYNKWSYLDIEVEFDDDSSTWFTIEEVTLE